MNRKLPPMKRYMQDYRNNPPPPPPFVAVVHRRRRAPYLTYRRLLNANGAMSDWRRHFISPQNFGGFQELRNYMYNVVGANHMGVIHNHQAVIYYLTHQDLVINRNQPFKVLDARRNWNTFANSVQRFRIAWVPINTNKRSNNPGKKPTSRDGRWPNARSFIFC